MRFGIALGAAGAIFYVGCMIFMATAPMDSVIWLSNSLLHGVDVKSILRESVPLPQSIVGILSTFAGGWLFGSLTACIYNYGLGKNTIGEDT
jgi:hypothetical protein